MKTKNVLIVDDELPALTNMQCVLAQHPEWALLASCYSCEQARLVMQQNQVDLILLDIQMPGESGLAFAYELCQTKNPPLIVFITAFDQHATSAFDVFALDYLLKPYDDERFELMLKRAWQTLNLKFQAQQTASLQNFLSDRDAFDAGEAAPLLSHLVIRSIGSSERIAINDIIWIATAANYVEVHLKDRMVLHRSTIAALLERLPGDHFMRVHRTAIVRRSAIESLKISPTGNHLAILSNGNTVRVSDSYTKHVQKLFA